ncbi:Crp/Fnr family transcriptional regulator [Micromonosporaceae bacterium Da 78-11]
MGSAAFDAAFRRWAPVPDPELAKAHALFQPRRVPARTLLQRAGEPSTQVSFIVRGLTRLYLLGETGVERTKAFRAEGDLVCAYAAALGGRPAREFIETLEPTELLTARREAFDELCAGHPSWAAVLAAMTERLFLDEERRHRELLTTDAAQRYHGFVAARPELAVRLTLRQIAAYVGVTPEALSRIRRADAGRA